MPNNLQALGFWNPSFAIGTPTTPFVDAIVASGKAEAITASGEPGRRRAGPAARCGLFGGATGLLHQFEHLAQALLEL